MNDLELRATINLGIGTVGLVTILGSALFLQGEIKPYFDIAGSILTGTFMGGFIITEFSTIKKIEEYGEAIEELKKQINNLNTGKKYQ